MDESQFKLLRELARDGSRSQRELSQSMGLSLGKVNYVIGALLKKGLIKIDSFRNSRNKLSYRYVLTPQGAREKLRQTRRFIVRKQAEYERLKQEIAILTTEANGHSPHGATGGRRAYDIEKVLPDKTA